MAWKKTEAAVFYSATSRVQLLHLSSSTELHQGVICWRQIGSRWALGTADESLLAAAATTTTTRAAAGDDYKDVAWGSWRNIYALIREEILHAGASETWWTVSCCGWKVFLWPPSWRLCVRADSRTSTRGRRWEGEVFEWTVGLLGVGCFTATAAPCTLTCSCKGALRRIPDICWANAPMMSAWCFFEMVAR